MHTYNSLPHAHNCTHAHTPTQVHTIFDALLTHTQKYVSLATSNVVIPLTNPVFQAEACNPSVIS